MCVVKFKFMLLLGLFAAFLEISDAANILGVFTSASRSHSIIHMTYAEDLAHRGHNVTVVTTVPMKKKNPLIHYIHISPTEERLKEIEEFMVEMTKPLNPRETFRMGAKSIEVFGTIQYEAIKNPVFQDFMHNPDNKFDLVIVGYFFSDYLFGLGVHFNCPVIISWMDDSNWFIDRFIGNPPEISYFPVSSLLKPPDLTTFLGRLDNFLTAFGTHAFIAFMDRDMRKYYNDLFPAPKYPSLAEASKKVSLLLTNYHFSEGFIRPKVPNAIEVGGIQIKDTPDPLPKDLQDVLDASSEHGVIYLSFGSNLRSRDFPAEFFHDIFKVLSGLKQTVLWKWDAEEKPGIASNIHFGKWYPQDDLLAHPNLKLFITHAGKGSVAESQFHGIPMVALPMFADQPKNAYTLAKNGFGVVVDHNTMTANDFKTAVLEVLQNPKYTENVKRFSAIYRDRPMSPRETAVFWIEYVIRHKGAYHMQSPLVHMNTLQYISADVVAFLLLVAYAAYRILKVAIRFVCRQVCARLFLKKRKPKRQ